MSSQAVLTMVLLGNVAAAWTVPFLVLMGGRQQARCVPGDWHADANPASAQRGLELFLLLFPGPLSLIPRGLHQTALSISFLSPILRRPDTFPSPESVNRKRQELPPAR